MGAAGICPIVYAKLIPVNNDRRRPTGAAVLAPTLLPAAEIALREHRQRMKS